MKLPVLRAWGRSMIGAVILTLVGCDEHPESWKAEKLAKMKKALTAVEEAFEELFGG